jgi:murein DD-endopeptidase MepM/ murein hydrolase activator NlpD
MKRIARIVLALAVATASARSGHAAPWAGPALPADPTLALAALDRKIAILDASEQTGKLEISQIGARLAAAHARVLGRGKQLYKLTRAGLLPVGGGFDQLVTYAMHVERMRRLLGADLADEARLRNRAVDLAAELERIARDRVALSTQRSTMDAARQAVADDARRQAAFDRAFQTSRGAPDFVAVGGGGDGIDPGTTVSPFAAARGKLLFPVAGRADVRPARREGVEGSGLEVHAPAGTPVRATFAGHVAFADHYGPYGRIVILDHGDHYYTVSGNLDEIDVKIGQDVDAGERIGTVGDDGQGSLLYFEVRHSSRTLPPGPWLGL